MVSVAVPPAGTFTSNDPASSVTVWAAESLFTMVICCPAVAVSGPKAKPAMVSVAPVAGVLVAGLLAAVVVAGLVAEVVAGLVAVAVELDEHPTIANGARATTTAPTRMNERFMTLRSTDEALEIVGAERVWQELIEGECEPNAIWSAGVDGRIERSELADALSAATAA